jgi:rod shape-determining protein MreC
MKILKYRLAATILVLSVGFLVLIAISVKRGNASFVENGVGVTFNSVQGIIYKATNNTKEWFGFVTHFTEIKSENESLKKQNAEMKGKISAYNQLEVDNKTLRSMLNFKDQNSQYNFMGADIVGSSGGDYLQGFTINQGSSNGVKKGMVVTSADGYLIGQIKAVSNNYSEVWTIRNQNVSISSQNMRTGKIEGVVQGYSDSSNSDEVILTNLPPDSDTKVGDEVVTSGIGSFYPSNLIIGTVSSVTEDKVKISKQAVIKPNVDFTTLKEVVIIIPKDSSQIKY